MRGKSGRDIITANCWTRLSCRTRDALDDAMLSLGVLDCDETLL